MDYEKPTPLNLNGNLKENWKKFKSRYEIYATATKTDKEEEKIQVARFLSCAGNEAIELFHTFNMSAEEQCKIGKVMKKFEDYCNPRTNIIYERYLFYTRSQREGEPFDHFMKDISTLIESCSFGEQKESILRDRIVLGIADQNTQSQLLKVDDLNLTKAVEMCRIAELTSRQTQEMQHQTSSVHAVNHNKGSNWSLKSKTNFENDNCTNDKPNKYNFRSVRGNACPSAKVDRPDNSSQQRKTTKSFNCRYCNYMHSVGKCPAYGKQCMVCGKMNHFAAACSKQKNKVNSNKRPCRKSGSWFHWEVDL